MFRLSSAAALFWNIILLKSLAYAKLSSWHTVIYLNRHTACKLCNTFKMFCTLLIFIIVTKLIVRLKFFQLQGCLLRCYQSLMLITSSPLIHEWYNFSIFHSELPKNWRIKLAFTKNLCTFVPMFFRNLQCLM